MILLRLEAQTKMPVTLRFLACLICPLASLPSGHLHATDYAEIYGHWQAQHTPCNEISDDTWQIDRTGVTSFESSCTILQMKKRGSKYTFEQRCDFGMGEEEIAYSTVVVDVLSRDRARINGSLYNRCPAP